MIKLTVRELTHTQMELTTMEIGLMTSSMEMGWSLGLMELSMRDSTKMERKMGKVSLHLLMEATMMESSSRMRLVEKVDITGLMESTTKVNGRKTKCTDKESLYGKMAKNTKVNS
jgi:hypothetical protein